MPEQSEDWAHCTHRDVAVSQTGAAIVVQPALLVHPARQAKVLASQMGVVVPQSELARHATHVWVATWHSGLAAAQSVFASH
jgi:RES domain-containing protein